MILRRTRGQLVTRSRDGTVRVTANGRGDWIGWPPGRLVGYPRSADVRRARRESR